MMVKTSQNLVLFWRDGQLICDNFLACKQRALSPIAEPLLRWFSDWKDINTVVELERNNEANSNLRALTQQLLDAGILIEQNSEAHRLENKLKIWDVWGQGAKYFRFSGRTSASTKFLSGATDADRLSEKANLSPPPSVYKEYSGAKLVPLDKPYPTSEKERNVDEDSFINVLLRRRTTRVLAPDRPITASQLSALLYYVCGATHVVQTKGTGEVLLKTSPSGGARHSIEVYPCVFHVEGIDPGIYHYSVKHHGLELISPGDYRDRFPEMCGGQEYTSRAGIVFIYAAVLDRQVWKYETARAYRGLMIDLGHLSQTFYLVAAWLGLGAFFTAAFRDELIENNLGLDWTKEIVLGVSGAGILARSARERQHEALTGLGEPLN
jgi:SagB-type dehydrogenase family enzyme